MPVKINDIRRLYNALGQSFDRQVLDQAVHASHRIENSSTPVSAGQAFSLVLAEAKNMDTKARLKLISAADGVQADGRATRWEFFFDLPRRRAKLECAWFLVWDKRADAFVATQVEVRAQPFPASDNKLRQLVDEGELLYQQLRGLWQQERKRTPDLPHKFRDSDAVIRELAELDNNLLNHELSLSTGLNPQGKPCWVARTRSDNFYLDL